MIKKVSELLGTVLTFLSSTGLVWLGYGGGALAVFLLTPKNWFWGVIFGVLVGLFVMKNLEILRPWAVKQFNDLKGKVGL